jgi:8-oxo-dGTP diphosphatase
MNIPQPRRRASAIIIAAQKILLIHRKNSERGEYYIFPGGGIEEGETPEQTAIRELKEEGGVEISNLRLFSQSAESTIYRDQYFFFADIKNNAKPVWQEKEKQTPDNSYAFVWLDINLLATTEVLPHEIRIQLISALHI